MRGNRQEVYHKHGSEATTQSSYFTDLRVIDSQGEGEDEDGSVQEHVLLNGGGLLFACGNQEDLCSFKRYDESVDCQ